MKVLSPLLLFLLVNPLQVSPIMSKALFRYDLSALISGFLRIRGGIIKISFGFLNQMFYFLFGRLLRHFDFLFGRLLRHFDFLFGWLLRRNVSRKSTQT